jgi:hypothetical protein
MGFDKNRLGAVKLIVNNNFNNSLTGLGGEVSKTSPE